MEMKNEMYPDKIFYIMKTQIAWIGLANEHLYCVLSDGRTFRLDRFDDTNITSRKWIEVATIPL